MNIPWKKRCWDLAFSPLHPHAYSLTARESRNYSSKCQWAYYPAYSTMSHRPIIVNASESRPHGHKSSQINMWSQEDHAVQMQRSHLFMSVFQPTLSQGFSLKCASLIGLDLSAICQVLSHPPAGMIVASLWRWFASTLWFCALHNFQCVWN